MTYSLRRFILPAAVACALLWSACDDAVTQPDVPTLQPTNNDATAGSWKPVYVSTDSLPALSAPAATGSAEYQAELAQIRTMQASMTDADRAQIRYWSSGAVVRWNQLARTLVQKWNYARPVGAALNPLQPIMTPPAAARAYALVSIAQYDGLVAAWRAKYAHNRLAPYRNDPAISAVVPIPAELPAYPSEHAVVAAASARVLAFIFPGDSAQIYQAKAEHERSRMMAGANTASEIAAADNLGEAVAARVIAYAKADGAKNGRGGDTVVNAAKDPTKWFSMENPPRPPMLPLWGKVKLWFVPSVELGRPAPPPALDSPEFLRDLNELRDMAKNRTREQWRIADYWADGAGTFTPPGHWNAIADTLVRQYNMSEIRAARAFAYMNASMHDAAVCCWDAKYLYNVPRPENVDPSITTATGLPNFPSYTSGHSTFSAAGATVLGRIFPAEAAQLNAKANEAAVSRLYGCIHYRFDNDAGLDCGRRIGGYTIEHIIVDGGPQE